RAIAGWSARSQARRDARDYGRVIRFLYRRSVNGKEETMRITSLVLALVTAGALAAFGQEETVQEIKHGAKKAGEKIKEGAETVAETTKEAAKTVGEKTKE